MLKYFIGAISGGILGYFVIYRLIGCSKGSCPITSSPLLSTLYGIVLGVLLAYAIVPSAKPVDLNAAEYKKITAQEAKARIDSGDDIIILDVRTKTEYEAGHIPGALLLPNEEIDGQKPELLPELDAEILIYCRSGNRSAQAARKLLALGYTNVYDFGGIIDWPYETVTGP